MRFFLTTMLFVANLVLLPLQGACADEYLVAVILTKDLPRYKSVHEVFISHLSDAAACRIYVQTPNEDILSLRNSARKAVAIGADLIVTYGALATRAALSESFVTPIVYADVFDPMVQGFIPDQSTPGKNITGIRGDGPIQTLLKHFNTATGVTRLAALYHAGDTAAENQVDSLQRIAYNKGLQIMPLAKVGSATLRELFEEMPNEAEGIYCTDSLRLLGDLPRIIDLATTRGIPVISQVPGLAEQGAFMVLETDPAEQGEKLAEYVNRLVRGCPLHDLPPERPRNVALVINLKVAQTLGIQVPFEVLSITSRLVR
jgi:putative ABC transport system substrate-binding protein